MKLYEKKVRLGLPLEHKTILDVTVHWWCEFMINMYLAGYAAYLSLFHPEIRIEDRPHQNEEKRDEQI